MKLLEHSCEGLLGSRNTAFKTRKIFESFLLEGGFVEIDFSGIGVMAQGYADELFGVFVLYEGPEILKRIRFSNCSDAHKSVVKFVVAYRAKDHKKLQAETDITSSSGKTKE